MLIFLIIQLAGWALAFYFFGVPPAFVFYIHFSVLFFFALYYISRGRVSRMRPTKMTIVQIYIADGSATFGQKLSMFVFEYIANVSGPLVVITTIVLSFLYKYFLLD